MVGGDDGDSPVGGLPTQHNVQYEYGGVCKVDLLDF